MEPMYRGIPFSPQTTLADSIGAADTIIPVADVSVFPDPPNYATIGIDEGGETISYAAKTDHALSGCTRGVEGTPKSWASGSVIARNFTAKDLESLQKNLRKIINDAPFVSAGSAQTLTDAQKEQARVNIGASHIRVESTNIGGDTIIQVVVTDADGKVFRFNPKGSDGGVWVPEYNEDTGVIDWEYHKAGDFYPVPSPVPTGIPVPATAAVGQTIVVSEVDADGKPTKWEAATIGATAPSATLGCMLDLFKKALYVEDTSDLLSELEKLIGTGGGDSGGSDTPEVPDLPDEPEPVALPSWIQEMQVVEFTPEADTNEVQTFAINMENEPNMVIVRSDIETPTNIRDFVGMLAIKTLSGTYAWVQFVASTMDTITGVSQPIANDISFSSSAISVQSLTVGGTATYWRAGYKYTVYCIRTTFDPSDMLNAPFAKETYAVTYEPEADSNEAVTFEYEMENEPNCVLIISDHTEQGSVRDVAGFFGAKIYDDTVWRSMNVLYVSGFKVSIGNDGDSSGGYVTVGDGVLTYTPFKYGGTACYFRAARKYMVIMMHI